MAWLAGLVILLGGCAASASYTPAKKYAPEALLRDAELARQTLEANHPALTWYEPAETISKAFNVLQASLTDSLTETQFRLRMAKALATIRCGHTSVRPSKAASKYARKHPPREPVFPLQVKVWGGDSMVVLANAHRSDSVLVRGVLVHAINGRTVAQILDSLCQFISTDGYHRNFAWQLISNNFPAWHKSVFGLSDSYAINYTSLNSLRGTATVKNFDPRGNDSAQRRQKGSRPPIPDSLRGRVPLRTATGRFTIDTARSLAIMVINSFSSSGQLRFFRQSFATLQRMRIQHLVLELRENGGGKINNSTKLTRYLVSRPFRVADTVAAKSLEYPYPGRVREGLLYKLQALFVTRRMDDGQLHYRSYETKYFKPLKKHHFNGQVYIITGGFTFSASNLFITPLAGQPNVTIVGEETGGGAYGNSAINIPELVLPYTRVRMRLPLYRMVINSKAPHDGRGIQPDVPVPPGSYYLATRQDPKMLKVYELLGQKKGDK